MKACRDCGETKPFSEFYANKNMRDGYLSWCKPCCVKRWGAGRARRAREFRERVQQIKLERGCVDCGYNAHPAALDFDHLPGFEKSERLAVLACGSRWSRIMDEIAKCEVVCANCHRIRTAERRDQNGNTRQAV